MKKEIMSLLIISMFIFLVGCLDYKAYDVPQGEEETNEDTDLINEIAQIEKELAVEEETEENLIDEDVLDEEEFILDPK